MNSRPTLHHNKPVDATRKLYFAFVPMLLFMLVLERSPVHGQELAAVETMMLPAWKAKITGALKIQGEKESASIHFWNKPDDTISWTTTIAKSGRYCVRLNYALDKKMIGGKILISAADHQIVFQAEPTNGWHDFRTFEAGVMQVDVRGDIQVTLQAAQLPQADGAALPDIAWLTLAPTDSPITSSRRTDPGAFHGQAIFDGKTHAGWEGDWTWFRIEDGALVGGDLQKNIPQNEFLCSTSEYGDFELRVKVKLWNGKGNGGIQFRSKRVTESREMRGYQADAAEGFWGGLYDESRRESFLGTRLNNEAMIKLLKCDDWNAYVIRCEGPRIRLWLNGVLTLDYMEQNSTIPRTGAIGLQIHSGEPAEVSYRDIELEAIEPTHK